MKIDAKKSTHSLLHYNTLKTILTDQGTLDPKRMLTSHGIFIRPNLVYLSKRAVRSIQTLDSPDSPAIYQG